ncbi:AAA family ATPase [Patulibacter sp.]|uniref:AAA family ATPase n=1 Tax=Patulibacter sp. TaxID=1912859 RepID=UPI0027239B71|nr:AAA family ATPase [Patulibacter sp.]MDO9407067.1 AAA family ATPase [Patulibacter sp.]
MPGGPDELTLEIEVVNVRYRSDDGQFAVLDAVPSGEDAVPGGHEVVVGPVGHLGEGDVVRATGRRTQHPKHGERFQVRALLSVEPGDDEAVSRVLQRVPGVGPRAAEALIERFGDELLGRLEENPRDVLRRVKGLTGEKLAEAVEAWRAEAGPRAVRLLLERHGLDAATIGRVIRALGDEPDVGLLKSDPYRLTSRSGIGFPTADAIAIALGEDPGSEERRRAAIVHALARAEDDGHCHLPHDEAVSRTTRLLAGRDVPWSAVDALVPAVTTALQGLIADHAVVDRDGRVATLELDEAEALLAEIVARMTTDVPTLDVEVDDDPPTEAAPAERLAVGSGSAPAPAGGPVAEAERRASADPLPSAEQWEAVRLACAHRLSILTGGPGTGKTQTMRALVRVLKDAGRSVLLCAPTGKAARRLSDATGAQATTIHRLLGFVPGDGFQHDEDDPIPDGGMLVVDEASMLPLDLAVALLRAVGPRTHVLLVGDVDQLAPVGPGRVLQDLLESGVVPAVRLTRIFRQAERSLIVRSAHAMNHGQPPITQPGPDDVRDFFFIDRADALTAADEIVSLATARLPAHYAVSAVGGVQVLAPQRRGACGVEALNARMREILNPGGRQAKGSALREGDRVMQTRNDHESEVMNGELGMLVRVDGDDALLQMDDGRTIRLPVVRLDTWELAYACTVHKAQGSSIPVAVVPVLTEHRHMLTRNLLYTAVTRAEKACVMVGDRAAVRQALGRVDGATRYTALPARIRDALGDAVG